MRSGREHNTPDKAVWGFKVNIRAQEQEDTTSIKPLTADVALTVMTLVQYNLQVKSFDLMMSIVSSHLFLL